MLDEVLASRALARSGMHAARSCIRHQCLSLVDSTPLPHAARLATDVAHLVLRDPHRRHVVGDALTRRWSPKPWPSCDPLLHAWRLPGRQVSLRRSYIRSSRTARRSMRRCAVLQPVSMPSIGYVSLFMASLRLSSIPATRGPAKAMRHMSSCGRRCKMALHVVISLSANCTRL